MEQPVCPVEWRCPSTCCCCTRARKPASAPRRWRESTREMKTPSPPATVSPLRPHTPPLFRSITFVLPSLSFFVFFQVKCLSSAFYTSESFFILYSWTGKRRSGRRSKKTSWQRCFRRLRVCVLTEASWQQREQRAFLDQARSAIVSAAFLG